MQSELTRRVVAVVPNIPAVQIFANSVRDYAKSSYNLSLEMKYFQVSFQIIELYRGHQVGLKSSELDLT